MRDSSGSTISPSGATTTFVGCPAAYAVWAVSSLIRLPTGSGRVGLVGREERPRAHVEDGVGGGLDDREASSSVEPAAPSSSSTSSSTSKWTWMWRSTGRSCPRSRREPMAASWSPRPRWRRRPTSWRPGRWRRQRRTPSTPRRRPEPKRVSAGGPWGHDGTARMFGGDTTVTVPRCPAAEHDAVVIGAGPNGLVGRDRRWPAPAGACSSCEAAATPGGGCRTAELTEPGFRHDVCSAIHPLRRRLPGAARPAARAHGRAVDPPGRARSPTRSPAARPCCTARVDDTAAGLGADGAAWRRLMAPFDVGRNAVRRRPAVAAVVPPAPGRPGPLRPHRHPPGNERRPRAGSRTERGRGPVRRAGRPRVLPLDRAADDGVRRRHRCRSATSSAGRSPRAASQAITDALVAILAAHGGEVVCDHRVDDLAALPPAKVVLADVVAPSARGHGRRPASRPRPPPLVAVPPRTGRVQGRLRAVRAGAVVRSGGRPARPPCTSAARWPRSPPPRRRSAAASTRRRRSCSSPSRRCSTRRGRRRAGTRCGRTATCRPGRRST